jgi:ketosteroid isomerase-like protein
VSEAAVREAVDRLVAAFGEGRLDDYFASFHPDCSFVFHTTPERLPSVEAYQRLWRRWVEDDGFEVVSCTTSGTEIRSWGDVAVVTHDVATRIRTRGGEEDLAERETIVMARQPDGRWLGIHEHLSPSAKGDRA